MLSSLAVFSQLKEINSFGTADTVVFASVDRPGELYVVLKNNDVQKFDIDGTLLHTVNFGFTPAILEPRDGSRIFISFRENNSFHFLPPSLQPRLEPQYVDSAFAITPFLVCPAGDYNLVVLDSADWSLKKISLKKNELLSETVLQDTVYRYANFTYMREYQNLLFLLDKNHGIRMYSTLGKYLKSIPIKDLSWFNFIGEDLYYIREDKLHFINLFTLETRVMQLPFAAHFAILTDERLFLADHKTIRILTLKP
ncbi:MAG TPA: hypothetical protein VD884_13840 [Ohtaekwangia sp.]|nr:hypothetical protein [Ohtaekwangia sp.]